MDEVSRFVCAGHSSSLASLEAKWNPLDVEVSSSKSANIVHFTFKKEVHCQGRFGQVASLYIAACC